MATPSTSPTLKVREVARKVRGQPTSDGAGVRMTRVIGSQVLDSFDPFLLLDEFRSDDPNDYIAGFPDHPHRGFETVTYMLAGRMRHGDNQGNTGLLGPGSVQWMTAGRGIVHSEFPEQQEGLMWGFQLWVNLPRTDKMTAPRYQDIPAADVPEVELGPGARARVLVGNVGGTAGPVTDVATEPVYFDLQLDAGASYTAVLPAGHNVFAYVYERRSANRRRGDGDRARRARADDARRDPARDCGRGGRAVDRRRRPAVERARRAVRPVRHEHGRRAEASLRGLSSRPPVAALYSGVSARAARGRAPSRS